LYTLKIRFTRGEELFPIDPSTIKVYKDQIVQFIRDYLLNSGHTIAVLGLSGGIDSALTYLLSCEALGEMNTIGVLMPYRDSAEKFTLNAQKLIDMKGGKKRHFNISESVDSFRKISNRMTDLRIGNIMARSRMIALFDIASEERGLVIGTGNKTEILLGYFTLFGDGGCSIEPLGDLYKTEVYEMARLVGVPDEIINQIPTADLWNGQTDEGELGISYKTADTILYFLIEKNFTEKEIEAHGIESDDIRRIVTRMKNSKFKRTTPPVPNLRKQNRDEFI
jgi:NAD+ synthase